MFGIMSQKERAIIYAIVISMITFTLIGCTLIPEYSGSIVFESERDGNREIYVMQADGTQQLRLTSNPSSDYHPKWSPDTKQIIFVSERDGNPEIYVMQADGTQQLRLTSNSSDDRMPAWSPDGQYIAFVSQSETDPSTSEIYSIEMSSGILTRITNNTIAESNPIWLDNPKRILFSRLGNDDSNYVIQLESIGEPQIAPFEDLVSATDISSNGEIVLFPSTIHTPDCELNCSANIYSVNVNGGHTTRLTDSPYNDSSPSWSIGDKYIVFHRARYECGILCLSGRLNTDIYVMNANGSNQRRLTSNSEFDGFPDWSPK